MSQCISKEAMQAHRNSWISKAELVEIKRLGFNCGCLAGYWVLDLEDEGSKHAGNSYHAGSSVHSNSSVSQMAGEAGAVMAPSMGATAWGRRMRTTRR